MYTRRSALKLMSATGMVAVAASTSSASSKRVSSSAISRLTFGSCAHQDKEQPIWEAINALNPDLFVFLGDNIYGDTRDMQALADQYAKLGAKTGFNDLRQRTPILATWDDHDYGEDDAGAEFPEKYGSRKIFCDFFGEALDSPRRVQEGGIYTSKTYGPEGRRVQVILLDLRWNRSPLLRVDKKTEKRRRQMALGPYLPNSDSHASLLGEAQWRWLEQELSKPAELRIIGSSTQFISEFPGWECWSLFPKERQRFIDLIGKTRANGVMFISGDMHWAELARQDENVPYPLYDFTSSGLTQTYHQVSPNIHRLQGCLYREVNFGVIEIDWQLPDPLIVMQARSETGHPVFEKSILMSELSV